MWPLCAASVAGRMRPAWTRRMRRVLRWAHVPICPLAPVRGGSAKDKSSGGRGQALGDPRPVDDVPPGIDVVGAAVLVLQVVGVLPDVDAEQRRLSVGDRVVLVCAADDRQA